ncbi:MAG TPA: exodeoxyribonuclease VII large subunit [Dokdonella sp.]|nr:exodeoxyribonuclease VII large subunit [Dokdonella sp.]
MTPESPSARSILSPSALNQMVRDMLEDSLPSVWIEGELSNVSRPASGHLYFTLKDSRAQVRCAMFKPRSGWLPFKPADGAQVIARARVSLYEARGEFQLIVEHLELSGEGALRREFEQLKERLAAEGLFDSRRKRALPAMPRRIAIITSPTGAAIRDVLNVLARRFPLVEVDVLPVPVQGKESPAAIVAMLEAAARGARHDVILLTRGGGSLEDLWAFNDEALARAIARSPIPVVSAVGHEIDFSIADFVADLRAPTPSAAAELLVPDRNELGRALDQCHGRLRLRMQRRLEAASQRADHLLARLNQQRPLTRLLRGRDRLEQVRARMQQVARRDMERRRARAAQASARLASHHPRRKLPALIEGTRLLAAHLQGAMLRSIERRRSRIAELGRALHAVSPLATLARGYSILLEQESGRIVRRVGQVAPGQTLRGILADGNLSLRVEDND